MLVFVFLLKTVTYGFVRCCLHLQTLARPVVVGLRWELLFVPPPAHTGSQRHNVQLHYVLDVSVSSYLHACIHDTFIQPLPNL